MQKAIACILLAAGLAAFLAQPEAVAQEQTVYKWVDAEGVVHYDARPPADGDYEEVGIKTREPVDPAGGSGEAAGDEQEPENQKTPPEQATIESTEPDPEVVAERCSQARSNIEKLNQHSNILIRDDDDGERRPISSEERERMLEKAQEFIDEWC